MPKLSKKEEREIERRQQEASLLETYVEGRTNVDWENASLSFLRAFIADPTKIEPPLIPKDTWLKTELAKWEENRPKVPPGKVQDPAAKLVKYRQKFLDAIRKFEPQALEDLRTLGKSFRVLFTNQSGDTYLKILEDLRIRLVALRLLRIESNYEFDYDYLWGEIRYTFLLAYERFLSRQPSYERRFSQSFYMFIEERSYALDAFDEAIQLAFAEFAGSHELVLANFLHFQGGIYTWAEKYNLKKDWLIDYAHYLIHQFSLNESIALNDLIIGVKGYPPQTLYAEFTFKANGWWASEEGESAKEYTKRVTDEFALALREYICEASRALGLDELTRQGKPPSFASIEWLVCRTVKGWDSEKIVERFFGDLSAARTTKNGSRAFTSKKKHVDNEMRKLESFGLPRRTVDQ